MRVRRSAHSLSPAEWDRIHSVVTELHSQGHFDQFARAHQAVFNNVHGKSAFFPFHRRFVLEFENLGRRIDPQFTIPYWDTTREYRNPASSPVLRSNALGGNGEGPDGCLPNGIQGNWQMSFPSRHCLRRDYSNGDSMNPWIAPEVISSYIQRDNSLDRFREHIEFSIHGATHLGLGGDASTRYAPNDFFFHMHHANIDRLWWQWQNNKDTMLDYNGPGQNGEAQLDDTIPQDRSLSFGDAPVSSAMVLGYNGMCYTYDSAPSPPASYPGTRSGSEDGDSNWAIRGGEPMSPLPMLSGSSILADRGLEISRIRKALGDNSELKDYFPTIAAMNTTRLETILSSDRGAHYKCKSRDGQRKETLPIEYPAPMSEAWVRMHGFDPERVAAVHREACQLIDMLNNSTYASPY
ncbi:hypothetical protein LPJ53_000201 [Coemansia erecta]|uniref:Tyrosinase copper-binding domain-containing protein n=1 Tax=Coemansia erecta TaxID=147472 RepID=A0A9W7Y720_9FUNG|nr:hypothetical protein LPJ53_000201 [Coemansia erecta]